MKTKLLVLALLSLIVFCIQSCTSNDEAKAFIPKTESDPGNAADTKDWPESFNLGREATDSEIEIKDIDVGPDGEGLPEGSGTVALGRLIYLAKCASCHGKTGTEGPENQLALSADTTIKAKRPQKVIGNYWPYATTLYDYINRAMPFNAPGSLTANEVYSLTAYLLYMNKIVEADKILTAKNLAGITMPAQKNFVTDDRRGGPEVR